MNTLNGTLLTIVMLLGCASCDSSKKADDTQGSGSGLPNDQSLSINSANYEQILKDAISVLNLSDIDEARFQAKNLVAQLVASDARVLSGGAPYEGLQLASQSDLTNSDKELKYTCNGEGSLTSVYHDFGSSGITRRNVMFDQCLATDAKRNGQYQFRSDGSKSNNVEMFGEYSVLLNGSETMLSGEWESAYGIFVQSDSQSWKNAAFTSTGTENDKQISALNWQSTGNDFVSLAPSSVRGFVKNQAGDTVGVRQATYSADLTSDFEFISVATNGLPVQVMASMSFAGDYFQWNIDEAYPVSDLDSPLSLSATRDFLDIQMLENVPRDNEAQWQSGELTLTAPDGSTVSLRPAADDKLLVNIELNASGDLLTRSWSEGFGINCPNLIEGCGTDRFK